MKENDQRKNRLKLVLPTEKYREQVMEYKRKMLDADSSMDGCGLLRKQDFDAWIKDCKNFRIGKSLPERYVCSTQYICVRKSDNKLVGMLQIRHTLTPFLLSHGGHIGDSVVPDERMKGYATEMLGLGLVKSKQLGINKVLLACKSENVGSEKQIRNNGGVFENEVEVDGQKFKRFFLDLI